MALCLPFEGSNAIAPGPPRARRTSHWPRVRTLELRPRLQVQITAPPADMAIERDMAVPVADGTLLRINIFRPADGERHPVLISAHPDNNDRTPAPRRFGRGYHIPFQYRLMPHTQTRAASDAPPAPALTAPR